MINKNKQFDPNQMNEIRLGLDRGLDVSVYAKPEFDAFLFMEKKISLLIKCTKLD